MFWRDRQEQPFLDKLEVLRTCPCCFSCYCFHLSTATPNTSTSNHKYRSTRTRLPCESIILHLKFPLRFCCIHACKPSPSVIASPTFERIQNVDNGIEKYFTCERNLPAHCTVSAPLGVALRRRGLSPLQTLTDLPVHRPSFTYFTALVHSIPTPVHQQHILHSNRPNLSANVRITTQHGVAATTSAAAPAGTVPTRLAQRP